MGKIANKQVICEVLMEAAKTDQALQRLKRKRILCAICQRISRAVRRDGHRGAESGKHLRWPGQMREEALCGVSGMLPVNQKL